MADTKTGEISSVFFSCITSIDLRHGEMDIYVKVYIYTKNRSHRKM